MDDAALLLRIRVVVGSTRAAARSMRGNDDQLAGVLERGCWLLDAMTADVERNGSAAVRERFAQARDELAELHAEDVQRRKRPSSRTARPADAPRSPA